jgi:hypothetical protein
MAGNNSSVFGTTARRGMRCAIYTRKSTEEGLEQEFNTLDAQRDSAEAYIRSQREDGWVALPDRYDDGGYTGANMGRPALKKLLPGCPRWLGRPAPPATRKLSTSALCGLR